MSHEAFQGGLFMFNRTHLLRALLLAATATSMLLASGVADAHAKVVTTTPAANAAVASPTLIQVRFSEAIESKLSSLKLAAADGTAIVVMSMTDARDPATLSIMPTSPLKPGTYTASWSVVSDDGHKTHGTFSFTVRP
jgi:methionine-rich copper-binding protein CopC